MNTMFKMEWFLKIYIILQWAWGSPPICLSLQPWAENQTRNKRKVHELLALPNRQRKKLCWNLPPWQLYPNWTGFYPDWTGFYQCSHFHPCTCTYHHQTCTKTGKKARLALLIHCDQLNSTLLTHMVLLIWLQTALESPYGPQRGNPWNQKYVMATS